jgi:hypothetical protein
VTEAETVLVPIRDLTDCEDVLPVPVELTREAAEALAAGMDPRIFAQLERMYVPAGPGLRRLSPRVLRRCAR